MLKKIQQRDKLTVLLASQDALFKERILKILHENEHPVIVVDSCFKALEYLMENDFDCVIFDPDLRNMDGADAAKLVKKFRPDLPLIMVSDERSYESGVKIAEMGVYFRLGKPIDESIAKELVNTVKRKKNTDPE